MAIDEALEAALDRCYEAIGEPDRWSDALNTLSRAAGSSAVMFYPKNFHGDTSKLPVCSRFAEFLEDYVAGGWYENHYRAERGWPLLEQKTFKVILEHDLATDEERRRSRHYNDLYLRSGFSGFAAVGFEVDGESWCLSMLQSTKAGFFTHDDAARFMPLAPHLRRMTQLSNQFMHQRATGGMQLLEHMDQAAMLVDGHGRVIELNARAEGLLADRERALVIRHGRPHATHAASERRLQALLDSMALSGRRDQRRAALLPVAIERSARLPLSIELIDLTAMTLARPGRALAILRIIDPEHKNPPSEDRLMSTFGLTAAEARLAASLAIGKSLSESAEEFGIMTSTARDRLKSIFLKTNTNRQGQLIALLDRL